MIRKDIRKKRLKHWPTVFFSIPGFIVSSLLTSATDVEQNDPPRNCGYDFEATVPEAKANTFVYELHKSALCAIDAYSAGVQYGTEGWGVLTLLS